MSTEITIQQDQIDINVDTTTIVIESPTGGYPLPSSVYSVFGRVGNVVAQDGDYNLTQLGDVTITSPLTGQALVYNGTAWVNNTETYTGTVTSVNMSVPTGLTISGNPITTAGTLAVGLASGYVIPTQAALDAKVPYTGATGNVTLGEYGITTGYVGFDLTPTGTPTSVGTMYWDSFYKTPQVITGVGNTNLQIGQEEVILIHNGTGSTLTDGQVVYVTGSTGELPSVSLADASSETTSAATLGVVTETIANGADGFITVSGIVHELNTLAYTEGDLLWLSETAGEFTNVKPISPAHLVLIGYVIKRAGGNGSILVKIQNTQELAECSDVLFTSLANGNILQYNATTGLWENEAGTTTNIAEGTNLYYTDARSRAAFSESVTGLDYNSTTGVLSTTSGYGIPTTASQATWNTAYNDSIVSAAVAGTTTKTLTLTQQDGGTIQTSWSDYDTAPVTSVFGRTGAITAQSGDYTTTLVTEGTNMYYTQARFDTAFSNKTTTDLTEGTNLYYTQTRFNTAFAAKSTTDLAEGTNLYFTNARAQAAISGTSPISVASGVVSISQSGTSTDGYLSSTDWNTFNNKQTAGNYITALTGEVSASGPGSASATISNSAVIGKVLTGVNITGGTIQATDSILTAFGKVQNQINGLIGGSIYQGTWNASTNTPSLTSGVGTKGYYYIVSVAGTTNLDGITDWFVGDWAIFDGTSWQQVDNTDAVVSVNGQTGAVSLTTSNISEGTNLYYTDARARGSVSAGTGISYNSTTGVITNSAPDQTVSLTAGTGIATSGTYPSFTITNSAPDQVVALTGAGTTLISGTYPNFTITSNDQYNGTVTSVAASVPTGLVVTGSPITTTGTLAISYAAGYSIPTDISQSNWDSAYTNRITSASSPLSIVSNAISISQANSTTNGYLTSSDWTTFNSKQGALTLTTTGSSGSATLVGSTLNVPTYTLDGLGGISLTSLSATTPLSYNNTTGAFSIQQASGSQAGYLSSTDWTTFNSKQNALTNPVTGTGTTNYLPKFTGASTIGDSLIYSTGVYASIGTTATHGNLTIEQTTGESGLVINSSIAQSPTLYLRDAGSAGYSTIVTNNKLYINSSNVGIGTNNPITNLHIKGSTTSVVYAVGASNAYRAEYQVEAAGQFTGSFIANPSASSTYGGIPTSTIGITTSSTAFVIATSEVERMRITSTGKITNANAGAGDWAMRILGNTTTSNSYGIEVLAGTTSADTSFAVRSVSDVLYFRVRGDNLIFMPQLAAGTMTMSSGGYIQTSSDANFKTEAGTIDNGLDKVLKLKPRYFYWNEESGFEDKEKQLGFFAQEVNEVLGDEVASNKGENGKWGIHDRGIIAHLVKAIQEQQELINNLSAKVTALENKS